MTDRLQGKVALITGSDSGIGQATAAAFAEEGADVVVTYLHDAAGAAKTRDRVEAAGRKAIVVQLDISDEAQVNAAFDQAVAAFDTVDILMNNAGVDASGTDVAELSTETWDTAIRTNVYGPFFCCRRFIQERKQRDGGGGKIINVTSVHEDIPNAGGADYDCSKGAVRMLTRTLALELAPLGINVNSLAPGMVLTPFNQAAIDDPALLEEQVQSIPFKRAAEPAEIARLAVFIASSEADYCTGATFTMDGGLARNLGQGACRSVPRALATAVISPFRPCQVADYGATHRSPPATREKRVPRRTDDRSPGDARRPYSDEGGTDAHHAQTHDVRREEATRPKAKEDHDDFAADLAAAQSTGGHVDESILASDDKELRTEMPDLDADDLKRLSILTVGTHLDQGSTYVDLNALELGPFKALGDQTAAEDNRFVAKRDTDHEMWDRIVGQGRSASIERPGGHD